MFRKHVSSPNNANCPCGEGANPRHALVECVEGPGVRLESVGGGRWEAAAPLGRSPDTLPTPEPGYPLDEAKSLLRKRFWPDCAACEAREEKVRAAGRTVKKFMRELARDYPSMYLQDVQLFKAELEPLVADLEVARKQRDRHQRDKGHQP